MYIQNNLLSTLLQEKHVLVCLAYNCVVFRFSSSLQHYVSLNAQFSYEIKGKGGSCKHNTENNVTYPKINGNVVFSEIK